MQYNGAKILMECLLEQGVDTVFGYPGGAVLNIYDELYHYQDKITHILTAHEQGASHAADGYARATGKVGVCISTSGPGATNLVTGIATAYMDSVPMVAITGNVGTALLGKDSFQEIDILSVTMPITKHNYIVKDVNKLADVIREAFFIAQSGRPGPVLIDIPKDITVNQADYEVQIPKVIECENLIDDTNLETVKNLIIESQQPFIFAGGGIISSGASNQLLEFAQLIDAPVANSLMGTGCFSHKHKLSTGLMGMHGSVASNECCLNCDLLIVIGARFSDRVTSSIAQFAPKAKIIHIDIDAAEIGKNVKVFESIVGDAKIILSKLIAQLPQKTNDEWIKQVVEWKKITPPKSKHGDKIPPQDIMETIEKLSNGEAIITTEVGQHQIWAAQYFNYTHPRTFISSGGLGTMGFGTGASIGAQIGEQNKPVVHIAGDGSFRMNCNELATIAYYNIPVIIILMDNEVLGMVRQWQTTFYGKRYSHTTLNRGPNFVKLAEAYDIKAYDVSKIEDFEKAFEEALLMKQPVFIHARLNPDERVLPMVAPNASYKEMIIE
ncbi:MAG: acetolactate synthase, large subunit, biosynthetic type [Epulopiscium sp. Nele67-Bin005]|nr:MAG: acetolactate synthase, large subunit, biosynthetic type [Epulopiscium sp. Nele67-Bin005]